MIKNSLNKIVVLRRVKALIVLCVLLVSLATPVVYAQGGDDPPPPLKPSVRFAHLTTDHGLADSHIEAIFQDSRGFMWFGTRDGLSRYDGYHFTTYRHDPDDPNTPLGSTIGDIIEDDQGRLWLTGGNSITLFDPRLERFTPLSLDRSIPVLRLLKARNGLIWLGTRKGELFSMDPITQEVTPHPLSDDMSDGPPMAIWDILEDRSGNLWLAASHVVIKYDPQTEEVVHYKSPDKPGEIRALYEDEAGNIWFDGVTLHKLNPSTKSIKTFISPVGTAPILHTIVDRNQQMWLATLKGLFTFDLQTEQFTNHFTHNLTGPDSLSSDRIFFLFEDQAGLIWIGTENAGLNIFNPLQSQFTYYRYDPDNPNSPSDTRITSVLSDEAGQVWLGTDTTLNRFDPTTGQIEHYPIPSARIGPLGITGLYQDTTGHIWFGLINTLYRFDPETTQFKPYDLQKVSGGPLNPITSIYKDEAGQLWVGRERGGFFIFDPQTETFRPHDIELPNVQIIYPDPNGGVWLAYSNTLHYYDLQTQQLDTYKLRHRQVNALYRDPAGQVWIAARDGLYRFDPATSESSRYSSKDGLPSNNIMAIQPDQEGNLWLSTSQGLSQFNRQDETFHNYDLSDGLASNQFTKGAAGQDPAGRLYFGSEQGLTTFYPDQIKSNLYQPPVVLTEVRLFNKPLPIGDDAPLTQAVDFSDHLTFSYEQKIITFEFAALSYAAPHKNRYRYILDGFEDEWNVVGSDRRFATYTALPAGDYVLRIQGTNDSGQWHNTQETTLNITITPPWWATVWFRGLILLGFMALAYTVYRGRVRAIKTRNRQLAAEVSARTQELADAKEAAEEARYAAETANLAKSSFLANMSHELRSPLNAILGFAQIMARNNTLPPDDLENVGIIARSGEHLLSLINQVLDLSKIEAGRTALTENNFDFYRLLDDIADLFTFKAGQKALRLLIERTEDVPQYVRSDELKLRQVLINLLGNAVKFTEDGGIALRVKAEQQEGQSFLHFEIEDTGPGISPDEMDLLFEAFVQTEIGRQKQEGTGLGLPISRKFVQLMGGDIGVKSSYGQGSLFYFDVKIEPVEVDQVAAPETQKERRIIALAAGQPQYRLLIVDDDPINRQLLIKLLRPLGFTLKEAGNGQQAIDIWREWQPNLIWMDMRMPVMDGYEATRQIKATTQGQATAIIALTASSFEEERSIVLSAGCDAFLRKPFREAEIFEILQVHIGVQYIYQESLEGVAQSPSQVGAEVSVAEINTLSPELLEKLKQTVELSYADQIDQVIAEIHTRNPVLAGKLAQMAHNFEYDEILKL